MKMRKFGSMALIAALTAAISFGCAAQPTTEHSHTFTAWETERAASCLEAGESVRRCQECGYEETMPIPATGHRWGETVETAAPTCIEEGNSVRRCTVCKFEEKTPIPALGHQWKTETVVRKATCTEAGEKRTDECIRCGAGGETLPIPATGHKWGEETVRTPASCTAQGLSVVQCQICEAEETKPIPATGHKWGEETVRTPASCTAQGLSFVKCEKCGAEETKVIPPTEHSWGDVQTDANGQFRNCTRCGARDAMGNDILYTINVVVEDGCNFVMSAKNQVLLYRDSMLIQILEANMHTEIMLPRGNYFVRLDNVDDAYLSAQVSMTADRPFTEIPVRNNPEHDPEIHPVQQGEQMFNFLVKDTRKEADEFKQLYDVAAGKKLIYLDFFYVSCVPCEALLEEHVKFYATLPAAVKEQLLVIMVDTTGDAPEYINEYRKTHQIPDDFITAAKGGRIYNNVPNDRRVPHAVYLDGNFNLVRVGGASALADMIKQYIPTEA